MAYAAVILVAFATISMLIGTIFCPNTAGKTLEQIEEERYGKQGEQFADDQPER